MNEELRPKVGLGVMVRRGDQFLFGERLNAHGEHSWCPPGGHIEHGESFEQTARREALEEAGINLEGVKFLYATNDLFDGGKHYVTIWMSATTTDEPKVLEPEKMIRWGWFDRDQFPQPLFKSVTNLIHNGVRPDQI